MTRMLSADFSLEEMVITQVRGVDNTPPPAIIENLTALAATLEKVRVILNHPVLINSAYRSPAVNARVGGVANSAHLSGWAADFICPAFGSPLQICKYLYGRPLGWDQLIEEETWVHFSIAPTLRRQVLTKNPAGGYYDGLPPA